VHRSLRHIEPSPWSGASANDGSRPEPRCHCHPLQTAVVAAAIRDFSSIVFSDQSEILKGSENPDLKYNQVIRPWKSRLGLFYVRNRSLLPNIKLVVLTVIAIVSRERALAGVQRLLQQMGAEPQLVRIAGRTDPLVPSPPPGATEVETRW
jgi:hypothetical protein